MTPSCTPRRHRSDESHVSTSSRARISTVLDNVRRQLQGGGAIAQSAAPSIHDLCATEFDSPNAGLLCEQIAELMDGIAGKLVVAIVLGGCSLALALAIEEQRRRLRRTQAVLQAATYFLRRDPEPKASELLATLMSLATICESALTALDPTALGLPIPKPDA